MDGILKNGFVTGTRRNKPGFEGLDFYEVWNGQKWIDSELWNEQKNLYANKDKWFDDECDGCNDPFCECGGKAVNSPFDEDDNEFDAIIKLLDLSDRINKEIRNRLTKFGGDNK